MARKARARGGMRRASGRFSKRSGVSRVTRRTASRGRRSGGQTLRIVVQSAPTSSAPAVVNRAGELLMPGDVRPKGPRF